ncbi:MAG TPA: tRNA lysidine(34) synthetase TilS [Planctomycetota bacterium]|nr:tRNA lysidine(34) synthetase TilS [Planctomycetota bacterium]
MDLLPRFIAACDGLMPEAGATVVVAVSGGADSMALWDLLTRAARWRLVVWHLDHGLREEAALDAELLRQRAARQAADGFAASTLMLEREDIAARAAAGTSSIETAGREARLERLRAAARATGAAAVAMAHHRDDQAETVLANLLRGAGPVGRGGMPPTRRLADGVALVRPLLGFTRAELRAHLAAHGIAWHEDATNADRRFRRNFLRHSVLPSFEGAAPGFTEALAAMAADSRARVAETSVIADAFWAAAATDRDRLCLGGIDALEPEIRLLVWRRLLRRLKLPMAKRHLRALDRLATGDAGRRYALGDVEFQRVRAALSWSVRGARPDQRQVAVPELGEFRRGRERLLVRAAPPPEDPRAPGDVAWLDAARVRFPLAWRLPLPGERWRPLGAPGRQPVAKTMAERGIGSRARENHALIADGEGAVWVPGVATCERARIDATTTLALHLTLSGAALASTDAADYRDER